MLWAVIFGVLFTLAGQQYSRGGMVKPPTEVVVTGLILGVALLTTLCLAQVDTYIEASRTIMGEARPVWNMVFRMHEWENWNNVGVVENMKIAVF
jgi:hypothetical protein